MEWASQFYLVEAGESQLMSSIQYSILSFLVDCSGQPAGIALHSQVSSGEGNRNGRRWICKSLLRGPQGNQVGQQSQQAAISLSDTISIMYRTVLY